MLEGLDSLVEQDVRGLVDEEVNVLGHEDVGVDTGVVTGPGLFEEEFGEVLGGWVGEVGETVVTAEGEEVEGLGLVVSFQAVGHGEIVTRKFGVATHSSR